MYNVVLTSLSFSTNFSSDIDFEEGQKYVLLAELISGTISNNVNSAFALDIVDSTGSVNSWSNRCYVDLPFSSMISYQGSPVTVTLTANSYWAANGTQFRLWYATNGSSSISVSSDTRIQLIVYRYDT